MKANSMHGDKKNEYAPMAKINSRPNPAHHAAIIPVRISAIIIPANMNMTSLALFKSGLSPRPAKGRKYKHRVSELKNVAAEKTEKTLSQNQPEKDRK